MMASEEKARYACDKCYSRKASCSRELSGCSRCKEEDSTCVYSRSGIIRRNRKRKTLPDAVPQTQDTVLTRPQLADDLTSTHERLSRLAGKEHHLFKDLGTLFEEYRSLWHDDSMTERLAQESSPTFFLHEERAPDWVEALTTTLQKKGLPVQSVPPYVMENLAASRPHQLPRAWLIMFYSIAFNIECSSDDANETIKMELRSNIWLAFNDVRVMINADLTNMQALLILATQVSEFITPSLCWTLVTKACTMLQALGVTHRHIDSPIREQRSILFWRLNIFDKAMALTMARPPIFHHDTVSRIALPTLDQLLPKNSGGRPPLFHAHFVHQILLLSQIMGDIWHCVYGMEASDAGAIIATKEKLESWNKKATEILEATAIAEKPFLAQEGVESIDHGLRTLRFHYHFLLILLCRCHKPLRNQCTRVSQDMLTSLGEVLSNTGAEYGALVWQYLHYPFFVFMALFGEILVTGQTQAEKNRESLEAMEQILPFLQKLKKRTPLAAKMESIAARVIELTRSWLSPDAASTQDRSKDISASTSTQVESVDQASPMMALLTPAATTDVSAGSAGFDLNTFDMQTEGLYSWDDDFLFNGTIDWFKVDELA